MAESKEDLPSMADLVAQNPSLKLPNISGASQARRSASNEPPATPSTPTDFDPATISAGELPSELAKLPGGDTEEPDSQAPSSPKEPETASQEATPGVPNGAAAQKTQETEIEDETSTSPDLETPAPFKDEEEMSAPRSDPPMPPQPDPTSLVPGDETAAAFVASLEPPQRETSADLVPERVLRSDNEPVLRRALRKATFGLLNPGESPEQERTRLWTGQAKIRIPKHHRVAVISLKGGVGKTTVTTGIGHTLATLRGDHVVAVDANPDRGTLADRIGTETAMTVRDLLTHEWDYGIHSFPDLRQYLSQASSRLHVLASEDDPAAARAFGAKDYTTTVGVLERHIPLTITDSGTGLLLDVVSGDGGVLDQADQLVVVCGPGVDEAKLASVTLDFLEQHRWGHLVDSAVVAVTKAPPPRGRAPHGQDRVDLDEVEAHFRTRVRHCVRIPFDPHIAAGGVIELDRLAPATRRSFLELSAALGQRFNQSPRSQKQQKPAVKVVT